MQRKTGILIVFVAMLFLVNCAPKIARNSRGAAPEPSGAAGSVPASDVQAEHAQGNTPQGGRPVQDPVAIGGLSDDDKAAYMAQVVGNGKLIWASKCGKCHELHQPALRSKAQWTTILERMAPKAKLDETEKMHVQAFLHYEAKQ